jgi:outer membrane lipopolysaccharide assembly protein LptE/RlpB
MVAIEFFKKYDETEALSKQAETEVTNTNLRRALSKKVSNRLKE